jgi:hypothetical protein
VNHNLSELTVATCGRPLLFAGMDSAALASHPRGLAARACSCLQIVPLKS